MEKGFLKLVFIFVTYFSYFHLFQWRAFQVVCCRVHIFFSSYLFFRLLFAKRFPSFLMNCKPGLFVSALFKVDRTSISVRMPVFVLWTSNVRYTYLNVFGFLISLFDKAISITCLSLDVYRLIGFVGMILLFEALKLVQTSCHVIDFVHCTGVSPFVLTNGVSCGWNLSFDWRLSWETGSCSGSTLTCFPPTLVQLTL